MMMMTKAFSTFKDERKTKDDKVSMLERLALSTSQEEFEKALIKGSDLQRFFSLLQAINKAAPEDFSKEWDEVREFCKDIEKTGQGKVLRYEVLFKYLLHRISSAKDTEERKKLMLELNTVFLGETFKTAPPKKGESAEAKPINKAQIGSLQTIKQFIGEEVYTADKQKQKAIGIGNFSSSVFPQFDMSRLLKVNLDLFEGTLRNLPTFSGVKNITEALNEYIALMRKKSDNYDPDVTILRKLTLSQLLEIKDVISFDFIKQVITKHFKNEDGLKDSSTPSIRASIFLEAGELLQKSVADSPQRKQCLSYLAILRLIELSKADLTDIASLKNYLASEPVLVGPLLNLNKIKLSKGNIANLKCFDSITTPGPADLEALLKFYIRQSITDNDVAEGLKIYLIKDEYEKQLMIETLLSGKKVDQIKFLTEIELNHIRDRCEITISSLTEDGTITASLKNIPNLILTIYEINTINYYKTRKDAFDSELDVAGIIPTETYKFAYPQPPMEVHKETFEVARVKNAEKGLFIVELTGQGLSSRTIVKRGGLNLVQTVWPTSYRYCILDENKEVCKGESAKIWMADKEYLADENGWIQIPFQSTALNQFALIQYGDYAEPYQISLPSIELSLKTSVIFNEESLVGGSKCDFVITPKIFAQHGQVDKFLAESYTITVVSTNSDGVRNAQVFEDCQLSDSQNLTVNYHVPKKTTNFTITTSCQVNQKQLSSTFSYNIKDVGKRGQTFDITLHKEAEQYLARVGCINGIPIEKAEVYIAARLFHNSKMETASLETDSKGQVVLGSLLCVRSVTLRCTYRGVTAERTFEFDLNNRFMSIPSQLDAVEGEDVMLPALQKDQDGSVYAVADWPYTFEQMNPSFTTVIEDCRQKVEEQGGILYLTKLTEGYYRFIYHFAKGLTTIQITVSKGSRWQWSNEYIMTSNTIRRLQNQANYLTFDELKTDDKEVSMKVYSNLPESAKVTLLGYYSLPMNFQVIKQSAEQMTISESRSEFEISGHKSMHMSNKEISEELKYIIYRNQLTEDQYGSTLPRPTGLLCQQFNSKTKPDSLKQAQPKSYANIVGSVGNLRSVNQPAFQVKPNPGSSELNLTTPSLKEKGRLIGVKSIDADGRVSFDLTSLPAHLNHLVALVEDQNNFTYKIFERQPSVSLDAERIDQRLAKSMEAGKVHYYKREAKVIRDDRKIEPPSDGQFAIIDTIDQLFDMQRSTFGGDLNDWVFIKKWHSLDMDEKCAKYDEFACHELNFFIYCKDKPYFETVVKPHLANKARKDIVDYFLLGDTEMVRSLTRLSLIHSYAPWELAMAYSLTRDESILTYANSIPEQEDSNYKALFDSVLSFYQHEEMDSSHKSMNSAAIKTTAMESDMRFMDTRQDEQERGVASYKMSKGGMRTSSKAKSLATEDGYTAVGSTFEFKETYYRGGRGSPHTWKWAFWKDVLSQLKEGFALNDILSEKFILSTGTTTESLTIMAVQSLGSPNHQKNRLVLTKLISICSEESEEKDSILVSQIFFEKQKPFEINASGKQRICIVKKFVTGCIYTTKATVTNTTESAMDCDLILEIPCGSVPIVDGNFYISKKYHLKSFETSTFCLDFYFPSPGLFSVFPATASLEGKLLRHSAVLPPIEVEISEVFSSEYTVKDMVRNHDYVAIVNQIKEARLQFKISKIVEEAEEIFSIRNCYDAIIKECKEKMVYKNELWKYAIFHGDTDGLRDYLENRFLPANEPISLKDFTLYFLETPVLKIDTYQPKEYDPLVNPKVHLQGNHKHNIANTEFLDTYMHFLKYYVDKSPNQLNNADRLLFVVYLTVQDRQKEAFQLLSSIDTISSSLKLQTEYLRLYSFVTSNLDAEKGQMANQMCEKYLDYPILLWKSRFSAIRRLLSEIPGILNTSLGDTDKTNLIETNIVKKQVLPTINLASSEGILKLVTKGIEKVHLQYYVVDIETKFSLNPFDKAQVSSAGMVKPSLDSVIPINSSQDSAVFQHMEIQVPPQLAAHNLLVQASANGLFSTADYLPSKVNVSLMGDEIEVTAINQRLEGCYIKVYVRKSTDSPASFFKDGYTNLLGRFNYASLNIETIDGFSECSILALDKNHGAVILKITRLDRQRFKAFKTPEFAASVQIDIQNAISVKPNKYSIM